MQHRFETTMTLPLSPSQVFAFFCDADNLGRITPPELGFEIRTPRPIRMAAGTILDYRLRLFGIAFDWRTRIAAWDPPHAFVDEQLRGPYREWVHTHTFAPTPDGTAIADRVLYRLPLWPLGELATPLVGAQIRRIFAYRQRRIRAILTPGSA